MSDVTYFFGGWPPIGRILVVGVLMYVFLVAVVRFSGSRTLASMNAFDFIVTVAVGSAFGRALTARGVALAEAVAAFLLLIILQYCVAWLQTRWSIFSRLMTNSPALLYFRGAALMGEMRRQRVTMSELEAAVRKEKLGSMDDVEAIILESSGEFSVIPTLGNGSALGDHVKAKIRSRENDGSGLAKS